MEPNNELKNKTGDNNNRQLGTMDLKRERWSRGWLFLFASLVALTLCGLAFVPRAVADEEYIARLTELLRKEPNRTDLRKLRGFLLREEGRPAEALSDLDRALQLDPNDPEVRLQRGLTLSVLRRDQEAESELNVFLKLQTGREQVFGLAERGRIRARTGRPALAIADLTAAIAIQPALELYLSRGQVQESTGQLGAAAAGYQDGISRLGRGNSLTTALFRVQLAQQQFQSALALVNQEVARAPVKTLWLLRRAEVRTEMGQLKEAQDDQEAALAEANRVLGRKITPIHLLSRAKVLIAMARFNEARSDLEECVGLVPRFAECRQLLASL
jgi:tetratricopeptide (TPR) repeat protein